MAKSTRCSKRKYDHQSFPEILAAIKEKRYTIVKPTGPKYKSEITWAIWRQIFNETEEQIKDFYYCIICEAIFNINISNSGRCLKSHAEDCKPGRAQIDSHFVVQYESKKKKISKEDKAEFKEAAIRFIVTDMRPILAIKGNGLKCLMSSMTKIGAKYGAMSEKELDETKLIPCRATVSQFNNSSHS